MHFRDELKGSSSCAFGQCYKVTVVARVVALSGYYIIKGLSYGRVRIQTPY